jgi:hypothetical protein
VTGAVTGLLAGAASVLRGHDRELVCRGCRAVCAFVTMRPLSMIKVRDVRGYQVSPDGAASAMRGLRTLQAARGADGAGEVELARIASQIAYLRDVGGEVIYQLACGDCRTRHVVSLPDLSRLIRRARTSRVELP